MIAGQQVADGLSQILKLSDTTKDLGKLIGAFAPFLGAFSAVVSIVGLFGSSPELQRMDLVIDILNDGFSRMEYRFGSLEGKIEDLERTLIEAHFWTRVKPHLENVVNVNSRIKDYFDVTKPEHRETRADLLDKSQWQKQYDAFVALRHDFDGEHLTGSICKEVKYYTNVDRRRVVEILVHLYSRMVKGAMNLILIGKILGHSDVSVREREYTEHLVRIANTIKQCDETIKTSTWLTTWKGDLNTAIGDTGAGGYI